MSESTAASAPHFGTYLDEPPLSPSGPAGLRVAPRPEEPTPAAPAAAADPASIEALLLRYDLVTSEQLAQALGERLTTGRDIGEIAVEHGWVTRDDLAQVQAFGAAPVPPAPPAPAPEPAVEPEPEPVAEPLPAAAAAVPAGVAMFLKLVNGERIECGTYGDQQAALHAGHELSATLSIGREWPFVAGRFVRPDAIVSIDLEVTGS